MRIRSKDDLKKIVDYIYYVGKKYNMKIALIAYKQGDNYYVSPIEDYIEFIVDEYNEHTRSNCEVHCILDTNYVYKYNFKLEDDIRRVQNEACTCPYVEDEDEEDEYECHCKIPNYEEAKEILYNDIIENILIPNIKKNIE